MKKVLSKVFSLKLLNLSAWLTVILTIISRAGVNFEGYRTFGFPYKYITLVHGGADFKSSLLLSCHINLFGFLINIITMYILVLIVEIVIKIIDKRRVKEKSIINSVSKERWLMMFKESIMKGILLLIDFFSLVSLNNI